MLTERPVNASGMSMTSASCSTASSPATCGSAVVVGSTDTSAPSSLRWMCAVSCTKDADAEGVGTDAELISATEASITGADTPATPTVATGRWPVRRSISRAWRRVSGAVAFVKFSKSFLQRLTPGSRSRSCLLPGGARSRSGIRRLGLPAMQTA
ncbi:exported hypothetical protein [Pseudoclavibacter sp. 8L]|nr:exported hypothetical protein [Pseudoclavibacter sp. 8L]